MNLDKFYLRHFMIYEFREDQYDIKIVGNIYTVYGPNKVKVRLVQFWFNKFRKGNINLEEAKHSRCFSLLNSDDLRTILNEDPSQSCENLAKTLQS